jgi:hypothetical protein
MSWSHCPVRLAGDLSLVASFPILISRILRKGVAGVSVTTHGLHLIVFLARYLDLWTVTNFSTTETWKEWFITWYNPLLKLYLIHAASAVLIVFAYAHVRDNLPTRKSMANELKSNFFSSLKKFAVYMIPAALLAYRFHYGQHSYLHIPFAAPTSSFEPSTRTEGLEHVFGWFKSAIEFFSPADLFLMDRWELIDVAWSFSIYLSAIADIPQYVAYYHYLGSRTSIDWYLMANMFLTAMFRAFYIPHWVIRFNQEHSMDPIAFAAGVVQAFAFWMFFVLCYGKINNNFAEGLDEEAQWDEFDSRWGTVETFAGEWDGLLLHTEGQPIWKEEKPITTRIIPVIRVEDVDSNRPPLPLPPY